MIFSGYRSYNSLTSCISYFNMKWTFGIDCIQSIFSSNDPYIYPTS